MILIDDSRPTTTDDPTNATTATTTATKTATPTADTSEASRTPVARHWTGIADDNRWLDVARSLVPSLAEHAERHDREGSFVTEGIELARANGLLTMLVPVEFGGGGASHAEACAVLSELAHGCPATSLVLSMHSHLVAAQVWRHRRGLPAPALARVGAENVMLISTGASDWLNSSGTVAAVDGGYRVSGRKMPASGCPAGDVLVTSMRWEDAPDGPQVIHCSIPFAADGVSIQETWDTMGMRGTGSHTVVLDDVFVPEAAVALVRPADTWHPVWSTVLGAALPLIMSSYVGVTETVVDRATQVAGRRSDPGELAAAIGRMQNRLTAARDSVGAMIADSDDLRFDSTLEHARTSLIRKTNAAEACIDAATGALDVGGAAFSRSVGIERLVRDVHACRYHPLPAAREEHFVGRLALGLDPLT